MLVSSFLLYINFAWTCLKRLEAPSFIGFKPLKFSKELYICLLQKVCFPKFYNGFSVMGKNGGACPWHTVNRPRIRWMAVTSHNQTRHSRTCLGKVNRLIFLMFFKQKLGYIYNKLHNTKCYLLHVFLQMFWWIP